jgi:hypothetical protein
LEGEAIVTHEPQVDIKAPTDRTRDLFYIESTLPVGVTIAEYQRCRPRRPTLWKRLRHGGRF